jgi:hypothetical protein
VRISNTRPALLSPSSVGLPLASHKAFNGCSMSVGLSCRYDRWTRWERAQYVGSGHVAPVSRAARNKVQRNKARFDKVKKHGSKCVSPQWRNPYSLGVQVQKYGCRRLQKYPSCLTIRPVFHFRVVARPSSRHSRIGLQWLSKRVASNRRHAYKVSGGGEKLAMIVYYLPPRLEILDWR